MSRGRPIWAYAIRPASGPCAAICWAPCFVYGLTSVIPSILLASSKNALIACWTSGSVTPCSARKTIVPPSPPAPESAKY